MMFAQPLLGRSTPAARAYLCTSCIPPGYRQSFAGAHQRRFHIVGIRICMRACGLGGGLIAVSLGLVDRTEKESCQYLSYIFRLG
jgi:hypothetical protein